MPFQREPGPAASSPRRDAESLRDLSFIAAATALFYALFGGMALWLVSPPAYASPLNPAAGIALAAVIVYGRAALPGIMVGAFAVNAGLAAMRFVDPVPMLLLPLLISSGSVLQAVAGAALVRRFVSQPVVLSAPRDILRFGLLGGVAAGSVSASVATAALLAFGALGATPWLDNWLTWWSGDVLGVLLGAPLALAVIGRPRADWQRRQRTLGVPLLLTLALLAAGLLEFRRLDEQRVMATFERDADRLAGEARLQLVSPLHALKALHSSARSRVGPLDREALQLASLWWLAQPFHLQAAGYSERVSLDRLADFESLARASDHAGYRVFDRDAGVARAADGEVVAVRQIEPLEGNAGALGVNALSIPAARAAILATRSSGEPAATAGFVLSQSSGDEIGVVIYQALYRGEPADNAARQATFRGVVFVTLKTEPAMARIVQNGQQYLRWCLVDAAAPPMQQRLAGPPGCAAQPGTQTQVKGTTATNVVMPAVRRADELFAERSISLGGRPVWLRITANAGNVPSQQREADWVLSLTGLAAFVLLGAMLLAVTGHSRRTELAVQFGTADLRREMADRALAEQALRDSEARLRSILDHAPLGVMFLDPKGSLIECNPRLARMVGRNSSMLRGTSVLALVHRADAVHIRRMRRELSAGRPSSTASQLRLLAGAGKTLNVRVIASALRDATGQVLRVVCVLEDITEHLQLQASESALHRAEASSRAKSEFVSRMSHELRTPLNAMIGFAQLMGLDQRPGLQTHQREWVQQIQRAGWHLLEMINETLDLARIESGAVRLTLAPVALEPLVQACKSMLSTAAAERQIVLNCSVLAGGSAVLADTTRLKQVLINLLSNAIKYNRPGGLVSLEARRVAGNGTGGWVDIAVTDTGIGMSAEQMADLFKPYHRLGREGSGIEGTGIGLVISRGLSELMGGTLEVTSAAGIGSIFTLRLPAAVADELPALTPSGALAGPYHQRLVHYVEDNETNIEVMRGVLAQRAQIRLETSMLGLDGLAAIRAQQPDLVLLDMQLPDISGLELLRHLKRDDALAQIPVVVVSADATALHMQEALTSGAAHYVTKPLDIARFLKLIDEVLEEADTRFGM